MLKHIFFGYNHGVLGINRRNLKYVYQSRTIKNSKFADQKLMTKEILATIGVKTAQNLRVFRSFKELNDFESTLDGLSDFVIKPNSGSKGNGITVICDRENSGFIDIKGGFVSTVDLRRMIANIILGAFSNGMSDFAIVERRIIPSQFFIDLYATGLADVRIITYKKNVVAAMLRLPTQESSGKANLHQGGVGVGIDIVTGCTNYARFKGVSVSKHPDSRRPLLDLKIPMFQEMIHDVVLPSSKIIPIDYLGFDLALDQSLGPLVIEVNSRPGLEIQNINNRGILHDLSDIDGSADEHHPENRSKEVV